MPTKTTQHGQDWAIGSIIEMYEEQLEIISNYGSSGTVRTMGEKAVLISTPE
ncbi:hypothetical protein [Shewanella glacialipiscicola]|uniref:hypothetical protein n=1 Tax=Shewanella glacialipiscicola TaxID=614069 RepID=UPI003D7B194B